MGKKTIPLSQLPAEIAKISDNLDKGLVDVETSSTRKAGMFIKKVAFRFAPDRSGKLKGGIRGKKLGKSKYQVTSSVSTPWKYNFWVDNRPGVYGTRKKVPYPLVQKTGIQGGGFFTKSIAAGEKKFPDLIIRDISKIELVKN